MLSRVCAATQVTWIGYVIDLEKDRLGWTKSKLQVRELNSNINSRVALRKNYTIWDTCTVASCLLG